ncbi:MAG: TlyA family RNA methyltransferase [Chloroflexota bacterium]|nr:TlyA family RNA methyltransferase [Chloroflexota bacterium]
MTARVRKRRADVLLAEKGLAESREQAQVLIMEGLVFAPAGRVLKASSALAEDVPLEVRGRLPYVSRGGLKLAGALDEFSLDVEGKTCLDVGASTGGFTDCLLQRGATHVFAVDVGHGQLHHRLRRDSRVTVMEKVNARHPYDLPAPADLVVVDVSFISLALVLPPAVTHLRGGGHIVALVKPQFEASRGEVGRGGIVRDPKVHASTLGKMVLWATNQGLRIRGLCPSPILGDKGNREFFLWLQKPPEAREGIRA